MKIALSADGDEFGGAEISLVNLVRATEDRHEFLLIGPDCAAMRGLSERLPDLPCRVVSVLGSRREVIRAAVRELRRERPEILQVTLCNPGAAIEMQAAGFLAGIPTVAVEQLVRPLWGRSRWVKFVSSRLLSDHLAVGESSARFVEQIARLSPQTVRTIHNGVPEISTKPLNLGEGPIVGTVGRLENQKGVDRLIRAIVALPNVRLVIVGDGSLREELEALAKDLQVADRVQFAGWIENPRDYLAAFDVFVLPSRNEAFPLTIVEAMLVGTPVIAADVGSVAEAIVSGRTGYLVTDEEMNSLHEVIRRALDDSDRSARLASSAADLAATRYTSGAMAEAYNRMWTNLRGRKLDLRRLM